MPHHNNGFLYVQNAWSIYIPLCNEGTIIFLYDKCITEVKKAWIPFFVVWPCVVTAMWVVTQAPKGELICAESSDPRKLMNTMKGFNIWWIPGNGNHGSQAKIP